MWITRFWFIYWLLIIWVLINLSYVVDVLMYINCNYFPYYIFSEVTVVQFVFALIFGSFYRIYWQHRRQTFLSFFLFVGIGVSLITFSLTGFPFF